MNDADSAEYGIVMMNQSLQYSIWPTHLERPGGYKFAGTLGTRAEMQELVSQQCGSRADLRQFDLAAVDLPVKSALYSADVWVCLVPAIKVERGGQAPVLGSFGGGQILAGAMAG